VELVEVEGHQIVAGAEPPWVRHCGGGSQAVWLLSQFVVADSLT
jgi:hypothetical protein